ncbi:erythromycin esterase family protein [Lysinibacillus fusiformis]|uniref:erythromycin esterase family protein n=1 Tax=Lysinibacillus fusiformis TaxID=28031 RepID=UPI00263A6C7F|nr:erythromycin esterase family protein [Lysinibacillus fusiformis]MDC6269573.1 erythromycin esterase family protein [Lysinibacillus sphaericus]MDN4970644.1 erythromycin esterase family protein [Lysinibacillus fusiformis]
MKMKRSLRILTTCILLAVLGGCGQGAAVKDASQYSSKIKDITIPDDVKIIGFGEATHGNVEFQALKKDLFEAMMKNENVRVFVLEGDFGGAQKINQFIVNSVGTAQDAIKALDYGIYQTEQMVDFVQWMHDYNLTAKEEDKIYFYGNDMQRYDDSKKGLLDYYADVDAETAKQYTAQLEHVSNKTMRDLSNSQLVELDKTIDAIIKDLQSNKEVYEKKSSKDAFSFAAQYAQILKQRTQLFLNDGNYMNLRDEYLAQNLQWIVDFEATKGHDKVLMSGHNGHIDKTSATMAGYKSMGQYLNEHYKNQYFAIGTDFVKNTFQAPNGSGERKEYTIEHHNALVDAFSDINDNILYVDFEKASQSEGLSNILTKEQRMGNIGDDFRPWYKLTKMLYTIKMTPADAYDGLIIVQEATPTKVTD